MKFNEYILHFKIKWMNGFTRIWTENECLKSAYVRQYDGHKPQEREY